MTGDMTESPVEIFCGDGPDPACHVEPVKNPLEPRSAGANLSSAPESRHGRPHPPPPLRQPLPAGTPHRLAGPTAAAGAPRPRRVGVRRAAGPDRATRPHPLGPRRPRGPGHRPAGAAGRVALRHRTGHRLRPDPGRAVREPLGLPVAGRRAVDQPPHPFGLPHRGRRVARPAADRVGGRADAPGADGVGPGGPGRAEGAGDLRSRTQFRLGDLRDGAGGQARGVHRRHRL